MTGAKVGLDDFLCANGPKALRALLETEGGTASLRAKRYTEAEALADLVYVAPRDAVVRISDPHNEYTPDNLKRALAASVVRVATDKGEKRINVVDRWMGHEARKTADDITFAPGQGAICQNPDGRCAVNTWREAPFEVPRDWKKRAKPFVEHARYLCPDHLTNQQVMSWVAHMVQRPGEMPPWHVLMSTDGVQGVGRNWFAAVVARVVSPYAALNVDISALAGNAHGVAYNGLLARKLFAVVDELHASTFASGGRRMMEALKSTLTAETRMLNPKYGRQSVEFTRLRVLILSNHISAMPLDAEDRRFFVVRNPDQVKPAPYYKALYQLLATDEGFIASVWQYLRRYDISKLAMGRPPATAAKIALIEAVEPDFIRKLRDAIDDDREVATTSWIRWAGDIEQDWQVTIAMRALRAVRFPKKVTIKGTKHNVWIFKDADRWLRALPGEVAAVLEADK